jgi:hypothetical protein
LHEDWLRTLGWAAKSYWNEARTDLAASDATQGKHLSEECDEANQAGDSSGSFDDDRIGQNVPLPTLGRVDNRFIGNMGLPNSTNEFLIKGDQQLGRATA